GYQIGRRSVKKVSTNRRPWSHYILVKYLSLDPIKREVFNEDVMAPRAAVSGHLFDRTPPDLISAIITERGFIHPEQASAWMLDMPISGSILTRLGYRGANPIQQGE
ncbi:MAG: hypothetical protein KAV87_54880, partial [Desulfobacteraceae bacterium]|nr:hypothetical protein [Desulfobacteraceae bacterium]